MSVLKMNVRPTTENESLGQLTVLLGKDATFGLYSERNFAGDARILISAWDKGSKSVRGDYKFTCDTNFSDNLRKAKTEKEFNALLDSLAFAEVTMVEQQATKRNGALMFDNETGEPVIDTIYYLNLTDPATDVSGTNRKVSGVAQKTEKKASVFSWEKVAGGLI
jgi:hypothetical protein